MNLLAEKRLRQIERLPKNISMVLAVISSSNLIRFLINVTVLIIELTGDKVVSRYLLPVQVGALVDNGVHGLIAALSWLIVLDYHLDLPFPGLFEAVLCAGLASFIDIDHFLEAKSFYLKDALHISRRPIFHSTSLLIIVWIALIFVSLWTGSVIFMRFSWIFFTAGFSHHLRDGIRRGLWLYPFGSTSPLPYWSYITATALLPHLIRVCLSYIGMFKAISKYQHVYEV